MTRHLPLALLVAGLACAVAPAAVTREAPPPAWTWNAALAGAVIVEAGQAEILATPGPGATVFVADPEIADARVPDTRHVLVLGRKPGSTTAFVFTQAGVVTRYLITVRRPQAAVANALRALAPGATIDVFRGPGGMTVSGRVKSPAQAAALKAVAQQYLADKEVLNFAVTVEDSVQVNLQVRVAQVSRTVTNNLAFNWNALFNNGAVAVGLLTGRSPLTTAVGAAGAAGASAFGVVPDPSSNALNSVGVNYQSHSVNLTALVDALQLNGLVTVLAEPNLTATSGATASFLAGGEFPVPIPGTLGQISIEWKKFGVSVEFTPTVLDSNRISVRVKPEVSELSNSGSVVINSIQVPALAVRRADTTVELASGQSFAIAGMFQNNMAKTLQQFPGLGNLPILGAMFRSNSFRRDQSELVIIVTPYIVRPVDRPGDLHLPTEAISYSNDLERSLLGDLGPPDDATRRTDGAPHLSGPAGFMLEGQP